MQRQRRAEPGAKSLLPPDDFGKKGTVIMGGYGSGSWYRLGKRDTTDDHHSLDIRLWHRQRLLKPGYIFTTTWSRGERQTGSISVRGYCQVDERMPAWADCAMLAA